MRILLVPLSLFLIILALLLGLGVGIAFFLDWVLPGVGLEMALLVAVIVVGLSMLIIIRLISALPPIEEDGDVPRPPILILDQEVAMPRRRRKRS